MKKHYHELLDETYYEETLENGLRVILFHKKEYHSTAVAFGTPYGAFDIDESHEGKKYHFHPGIAHFLEHKLFESEEGDVLNDFVAMGASVNAFTSYRETVYHFFLTGDNIKEPLNLLLDFVQDLRITEASVEKEKGIINQELKMYMAMPDVRLLNETFKAMYEKYPLKYDVGGDEESVNAITKEELEECYRINYHPSNMILMITTYLPPEEIFAMVKENQKQKSFVKKEVPEVLFEPESEEVVKKEYSFYKEVFKPKHVYGIKLKPEFQNMKYVLYKEWCIRILLEAHFTSLNPAYQIWLDEGRINDYFGYEVDFDEKAAYILFYTEGGTKEALKELVDNSLKETVLNEEILTQLKRRYMGMAFATFNDLEGFNTGFIRDRLSGIDVFDSIGAIDSITLKDIKRVFEAFDLSHFTLVSMLPKVKE